LNCQQFSSTEVASTLIHLKCVYLDPGGNGSSTSSWKALPAAASLYKSLAHALLRNKLPHFPSKKKQANADCKALGCVKDTEVKQVQTQRV